MQHEAIEAAAAAASAASVTAAASKATYAGSLALLGGWLISSQAAALLGLMIAATGLAVQWYYRHKEFRMRQREHAAQMRREGIDVADPGEA